MTISFEYETLIEIGIEYEDIINKVIKAAIEYENCPYETEVNVILTDNASIQEVNLETRNIDAATDVLSFPMNEYDAPSDFDSIKDNIDAFNPETGELLLGDIMISVEKVISQAEEYGHSVERELGFLTAHSMLHLFGYDHIEDDMRVIMEKKQEEILDGIGLKRF